MPCLFPPRPLPACRDGLSQTWMDLGLSLRTSNVLQRHGFHCLADLAGCTEESLLALRGLGAGAVADIRRALLRLNLDLPFVLDEAEDTPCLTLSLFVPDAPQPTAVESGAEQRWCERFAERIAQSEGVLADRLLQELRALTLEHFSSLPHRLEEIQQLHAILAVITEAGELESGAGSVASSAVSALHWQVLRRYSLLIGGSASAGGWLGRILTQPEQQRAVHWLLLQGSGIPLRAIAQAARPAVTSEFVRQQIRRVERIFGCRARDLQHRGNTQDQQHDAVVLRAWICRQGRLPFHTDDLSEHEHLDEASGGLLKRVSRLNLSRRLARYAELDLPVPAAEWDLHCRVIGNREERPGHGYWDTPEPLHEFLIRYARVLRKPGVMPLQEQLPPSVQQAVQRHGGQSALAQAVGLRYDGQLVGDRGRTYWTDARLDQLLQETARFSALPADAMPSRSQIRAYMRSAAHSPFWGKRPESALAALTRWSRLSWAETARRFGRHTP